MQRLASGDDVKREHDVVIGAALLWKCDDDDFETLSSLLEAPLLLDNLHIYDLRQYIVVVRGRVKGLLRSDAAGNVYLMVKVNKLVCLDCCLRFFGEDKRCEAEER